jgi:hypothetical protein
MSSQTQGSKHFKILKDVKHKTVFAFNLYFGATFNFNSQSQNYGRAKKINISLAYCIINEPKGFSDLFNNFLLRLH